MTDLEWSTFIHEYEENTCDLSLEEFIDEYYEDRVFYREGASKFCVFTDEDNFVIKFDNGYEDDGASIRELELYHNAIGYGVECFMPKTELFLSTKRADYIKQDKIDYAVNNVHYKKLDKYTRMTEKVNKKVFEKAQNEIYYAGTSHRRSINRRWLAMALLIYGKKKVKQLCKYLKDYRINDLHESNIGYLNDKPIILDFCGYYGN